MHNTGRSKRNRGCTDVYLRGSGAGKAGAAAYADAVSVYLDGGACRAPVPSTIVDVTLPVPRVLRIGAISLDDLRAVCPDIESAL